MFDCRREAAKSMLNSPGHTPRICLVETAASGHHFAYTSPVVADLLSRGCHVTVLAPAHVCADPRYQALASANGAVLQSLDDTPSGGDRHGTIGLVLGQLAWHRALRRCFARPDAPAWDAVHVMYLDDFDKAIAVLGSPFGKHTFTGLLMSVRFHHPEAGVPRSRSRWDFLYRLLFMRMLRLRKLKALLSTDPTIEPYAAGRRRPEWHKVKSVPDFGSPLRRRDRAEARSAFGIPPGACVVLVYGTLTSRKGLQMLNAALTQPACPSHVIALVVGRVLASGRRVVESEAARTLRQSGRLIVVDRFLSADEEGDAFAAADLVWVAYEHFYLLSGVLFQALDANRPVLAQDYGLIAWLARRHGLGVVVDTRDALRTAAVLADFSANPARYELESRAQASCLQVYNQQAHVDAVVRGILQALPPPVSSVNVGSLHPPLGTER